MPDTPSDHELLRDYASNRSQPAFAQLVTRHVDLVWSAARRQVRDAHLAEDVTQAVFLLLARKAASLETSKANLAGWLYTTTHYAANNARRGEARRRARERKAGEAMRTGSPQVPSIGFDVIESDLDGAMARLASRDRDAVVMRFLRQMSLRDVGAALGVSEDAAKVRVARAVAKLREMLGVTAPASALATTLLAHGTQAAPAGLAGSIVAASCGGGAAASGGAVQILNGVIRTMRYAKLKLAAAFAAALVTGGAATGYVFTQLASPDVGRAAAATTQAAPDGMRADESRPTAALRALTERIHNGTDNGDGWLFTSDEERRCGERVSEVIIRAAQLERAATDALGRAPRISLSVSLPAPDQLTKGSEAYPDRSPDMALVIDDTGKTMTTMRRSDGGRWQLAVADVVAAASAASADSLADECERDIRALRTLIEGVEAGWFETPEDLQKAVDNAVKR